MVGNPERAVVVNEAFSSLTGYSVDELLAVRPFADLFPPAARDVIFEGSGRRLAGEDEPSQRETEILHRDGHTVPVEVSTGLAVSGDQAEIVATFRDLTDRKRVEWELASRARQQAVVADLGRRALTDRDVSSLLEAAVSAVARTLDVEYTAVFELLAGGEEMLLRAGSGWGQGVVGHATIGAGRRSMARYTLASESPVVAEDLRRETRFATPPMLADHGIVSALTVLVRNEGIPYGLLAAYARSPRRFGSEDVHFLRGVGNVLADAIARAGVESQLATRARQQEAVAELGRQALADARLPLLLGATVEAVARTLEVEYVKVLELLPGGDALLLRAGVGWQEGLVGHARVGTGMESQAGFTLAAASPVIVEDLSRETRFRGAPLLLRHGVVSGVSVAILGPGRPWGVLAAHTTRRRRFSADDTHFLQAAANVLAEAIRRADVEAELRTAHDSERTLRQRLQAHSRMVVEAQEAERRRIARELHDEIGQTLTGLKLTLENSEQLSAPAAASGLQRAKELAGELLERVHSLSLDLRPAVLDDLGLRPALAWLVERYHVQMGVEVALECSGLDRRLKAEVETAAYRIVQEALTNVARHAGVGRAEVRCALSESSLLVEVSDEGIGFDFAAVPAAKTSGLAGMEERARATGGNLRVLASRGRGTRIVAELPLDDRDSADS